MDQSSTSASASASFVFIDSSSDAGVPKGQHTRQLIRRQAMSKVATARKQSGNWGQQNRRQYPVSGFNHEEEAEAEAGREAAVPMSDQADLNHHQQCLTTLTRLRVTVPPSVPSSGYESMRINYGFDLLDVSALTTFHTGRITAQLLAREPYRLAYVLPFRQWSYLSFLPSRYGHSACLDNAANCVAARLRQWMSSPSEPPNDSVLSLYLKSLISLQGALNDPILCLRPEALCATAILGIYELLDSASDQAWVRHVAGASALMKLRGPQRYQTEFEKALFLAQAGPIYTEALLNADKSFLEQDIWQNVFRSVVRETEAISDSSGIVVSLWTTICPIPGLFKDVQNAVCNPIDFDMRTIGDLYIRVRDIWSSLLQWRQQYDTVTSSYNRPQQAANGKQYETLGIYMANQILINRLSVSLKPHAGSELEAETHDLARQILQLERTASAVNPRASLFMAFKVITAQAILETKDEWQRGIDYSMEDRVHASPLISAQVFERWVRLKGRKVTRTSVAPVGRISTTS